MPWLITDHYAEAFSVFAGARMLGWFLICVASAILLHSFLRFAFEGGGTPAPVAPTDRLVVGGAYRFVRNPMYVAVVTIILGQALLFQSLSLLLYAAFIAAMMAGFVLTYEEPTLAARYGEAYETYRRAVPRWLPRLTPWAGQ